MANLVAQLTIQMFDNGNIEVNGPIEQIIMCYGMLEIAKDTIRRAQDQKSTLVQTPTLAEKLAIVK